MTYDQAAANFRAEAQRLSDAAHVARVNADNAAHTARVNESNRQQTAAKNAAHAVWLAGQKK